MTSFFSMFDTFFTLSPLFQELEKAAPTTDPIVPKEEEKGQLFSGKKKMPLNSSFWSLPFSASVSGLAKDFSPQKF